MAVLCSIVPSRRAHWGHLLRYLLLLLLAA